MYQLQLTHSIFPAQHDSPVHDITVGALLRKTAAQHASTTAVAIVDDNGQIGLHCTYAELLCQSEKLALLLSTRFAKGERITVWAPNCIEWLLMQYACALAGLVLVTANPAYQAKELRYVLEQSGSVGLFLVDSYRGNPMASIGREACKGLASLREITNLDDRAALYATGQGPSALPEVAPKDSAQIQYTSGTTGFPKGAVLTHLGLVNNARFYAGRALVNQGTVCANFMPLFHTAGCAMGALGCLQAGCKMLLFTAFNANVLAQCIESEKVSFLFGVPTMLVGLLESLEKNSRDTSSLKVVISGGAPVSPDLVQAIRKVMGCHFETCYGQTEASPVVSQNYVDGTLDDICYSAGQPLPQVEVSIRCTQKNKVVPIDEVGEICVRGYCVMQGYHANQQATHDAIDKEGWLHTGDLGCMDSRGVMRITGRVKEMIIRGGENHFPVEVENVLLQHPLVAEVAVVGLPDKKWGEIIACFIRTKDNQPFSVNTLHQHCRLHLAAPKTPTVWCQVQAFPLTGSGKIQKFALRDEFVAGQHKPLTL